MNDRFIPDREELAWAGGLFSGEGSCHWIRQRRGAREYGRASIEITQCKSPEVLERFNRAVGGLLKLYGPYYNRQNTTAPYWQLSQCNFTAIQATIAMLWPWLSTQKREQAITVLERQKAYRQRPKYQKGAA